MILWPLVTLVTVLLLVGAVRYGQPALDHRRYARTLAHIEQMERELGIGYRPAEDVPIVQAIERAWAQRGSQVPEPHRRIIARCGLCKRDVAINAGACGINYAERDKCAKEQYRRSLVPG